MVSQIKPGSQPGCQFQDKNLLWPALFSFLLAYLPAIQKKGG